MARSRPRLTTAALITSLTIGGMSAAAPALADTKDPPTTQSCTAPVLTDNPPGSPHYDAVRWLQCEGIAMGYPNGTYRKTQVITRAETMAMLFRYALPHGTYSDYHSSPVFADVTYGSPFHDPITWAGTLGITAGHSDGSFGRSTPVTRAEFASFIHQWISPADYSAPSASPFPDMTPESGHFEAVTWMHENDIVAGFADGEFRPSRHITRGEMAAVLSRLDSQIDPHGGATSPGCVDSGTPTLPDASDGPQRGVLRAPFTVHLKRTVEPGECLTLDPSGHGGIPQGYDNVSLITLGRTSGSDDGRVSTRVNADGTINITVDRDYWNRYGSEDVHATPFIAWKDQENYVKGHIYLIVTR